MKQFIFLACLGACTLLIGCRGNQNNAVVKETYVHKYGVPVAKDDWDAQGKEGKVVQLQKDGVTVTKSYSKGVLDGETTYTYPNASTIHRVEIYSNGDLILRRGHYPSGMPMHEKNFAEKHLIKLTRWYEDGTPAATETYDHQKKLLAGEYRTPLNVVESRVSDGTGERICRSNDGELISKESIVDGALVERTDYDSHGEPTAVTPYQDGIIHGSRLTFLPGGLPLAVEEWVQGRQEGITVVFQNGEKLAEIMYVRGKKEGIERRFRDGTQLVEEISWRNDIQHGPSKIFIDGDTKTEWYHQGELVSRSAFERMNLQR